MSQGALLDDPCGGCGLLSYEQVEPEHVKAYPDGHTIVVPTRRRTVAARCLCEKGQLRMSPMIPLISDIVREYAELQDLYPHGIPPILERTPQEVDDPKREQHGPLCTCGHRQSQHDTELATAPCRAQRRGKPCRCLVFREKAARRRAHDPADDWRRRAFTVVR